MDFALQDTISRLQGEIYNLNKKISELAGIDEANKTLIQQLDDKGNRNLALYSDLQYAVRYFFEQNRNDDDFEFNIDEVNKFFAENSIEPLKREYRVSFSIEGNLIVEAENEEEARAIVYELDVTHWSADIEHFEVEATSVDTTF